MVIMLYYIIIFLVYYLRNNIFYNYIITIIFLSRHQSQVGAKTYTFCFVMPLKCIVRLTLICLFRIPYASKRQEHRKSANDPTATIVSTQERYFSFSPTLIDVTF